MPGSASRSRRARSRSAPGSSSTTPSRSAAQTPRSVSRRRAGIASTSSSACGDGGGVGKTCVSEPSGAAQRLAVALHDARGVRARRRDRDLLAEHRAHGDLGAVDAAGHAQAGARARRAARAAGRSRAPLRTAVGSASRSSRRRQRATATPRSRTSARRSEHCTQPSPGRELGDRRAVRQAQRAPVAAVGRALLDARDARAGAKNANSAPSSSGARYGESQRDRPGAGGVRLAAPPAQLARREREDLADRVVELPHAREAGRERDLGEAELGRLDQRARRLRALRARERERPGAELGRDEPVELPLAVAEARGESRDAVAVDDAVGDQAHRARDDVGARVPLGRAGRGVRAGSACRPGSPRAARRRSCGRSACWRASARAAGQLGRQ